jgi:hypothetical protein
MLKKSKNYLGNGNVVWTDGNIKAVKKEGQPQQAAALVDDRFTISKLIG